MLDTAHGQSKGVMDEVTRIKKQSNYVMLAAGNIANAEGALARKFAVWLENRVKVRARAQSYWRVFGQAHACGVLVWCHRAPRVPSVVRCAMHHRRGVTRPSLSVAAGVLAPDASTRDKPRAARLRKE